MSTTDNVAESSAEMGEQPWYRRMLVGLEYGPTGGNDGDDVYMAGITGREIIENVRRANAEYIIVFMKDHDFAYYNSKMGRKAPNLGDRDLLRECIDEAKEHGIAVVAYCQIQYDGSSWRAHPEWRMKDSKGQDIPSRLCYNSGYLEERKRFAAEMMEYEIVGFHFDMLDFGFGPPIGCWCECCRGQFREAYGIEMPNGVTWDDAWDKMLEFRCNSNANFCRELDAYVKSQNPELSVDFNYHGYPPFSWEVGEQPVQHAQSGDFVTAEGLPWAFGNTNPSLLSLFMLAVKPGCPVQGVTSRFVYNYHDYTVRPAADMTWEVLTYLSHGCQCTIVDKADYDGCLAPVAFERIGEAFGEGRRKHAYFGYPALPEVGLYYSCRSRDWYGREDGSKYFSAFVGAHKAFLQSHIPMGMIMDENVSAERLRRFPVVFLPNAAILTEREVGLFQDYVAEGGNLIATAMTGMCDSRGELGDTCNLAELLGIRSVKALTDHRDNYLRFPSSLCNGESASLVDGLPTDHPILTWGPIVEVETSSAQGYGEVLAAHRSVEGADNPWRDHMSAGRVIGPAITVNEYGKGKAAFVACCVDAAWGESYRMPEHRDAIRNLVRYLNPEPDVLIQAPLNVETVVAEDKNQQRLLVHFIAFWGTTTSAMGRQGQGRMVLPPLMEETFGYTAKVTVKRPFSKANGESADSTVSVSGDTVTLQTSQIHEVLIIEL